MILRTKPHSKFCNRLIEWKILIAKVRRFLTCVLNVSFRLIHIFNHLIIFWNFKTVSFNKVIELIDMIFYDSKWINSDFESSNCIAFALIHKNAIWIISISVLQFFSTFFDETLGGETSVRKTSVPDHSSSKKFSEKSAPLKSVENSQNYQIWSRIDRVIKAFLFTSFSYNARRKRVEKK